MTHEIFDEEPRSDFLWCLHCERTYKRGEFREVDEFQVCPYPDCDADIAIDGWDWETVRDKHEEYPEFPEPKVVYPLNN